MQNDQIREIVKETVRETLTGLGFDPERPQDMQEQIAFLRNLHAAHRSAKGEFRNTLVRWGTPMIVIGFFEMARNFLNHGGT